MHLVLTDLLVCPYCGPGTGLIVLAEQMHNRRVLEGALGCPACRRQFPIHEGVADLRVHAADSETSEGDAHTLEPLQMAALLGITDGRGNALLLGSAGAAADALSALLPGLELIAVSGAPTTQHEEQPGINRILADTVLPLRDHAVRGVILGADAPAQFGSEALRVLSAGGRLVISKSHGAAEALAHSDLLREQTRVADHIVMVRSR